jgi:multicomponent Na+:H+ antiporter subunit D
MLTKVGVYALIRTMVMLLPVERGELGPLIAVVAAATMIAGTLGALAQTDIRRLLGYIVVSGIGNILAGVALGTPGGIAGAIVYALHSMVLMTALYLAAGQAARLGGSYSLTNLGGLYRRHGWFAGLSLVLFFAASGLPPFSGFWPKVILVKASLDAGSGWLAGIILLSGFLTTIAFGRVFLLAYWRPLAPAGSIAAPTARLPGIEWQAAVPLSLLTALVVGFGLFPEPLLHAAGLAAAGLADPAAYLHSVFPEGIGK